MADAIVHLVVPLAVLAVLLVKIVFPLARLIGGQRTVAPQLRHVMRNLFTWRRR